MAKKEVFLIFYSFCFSMHSLKKEMNAGLAIFLKSRKNHTISHSVAQFAETRKLAPFSNLKFRIGMDRGHPILS